LLTLTIGIDFTDHSSILIDIRNSDRIVGALRYAWIFTTH